MAPITAAFARRHGLATLVLLSCAGAAAGSGDSICNIPETGTLQAGAGASTTAKIRLASTASSNDGYYTGAKIQITSGTGVGNSAVITKYCGQTHSACTGLESSGTLASVANSEHTVDGTVVASTLLLELPATDNGGRSIVAGTANVATCASRHNIPYMTNYAQADDCKGTLKGFNIYITGGTGAGQVGLIRAGPDDNRKILVTGLFGTCQDTAANQKKSGQVMPDGSTTTAPVDHDKAACRDNWHRDDPSCKANLGSPCITKSDCTGDPAYLQCSVPVNSATTYMIKKDSTGDTCDPSCNGVASHMAWVDFSSATDATSVYSIQRGCFDTRFTTGMRRMGSSGSGAGAQNVHLDWKTLMPNGEIVASPVAYSNGDIVVASLGGSLTKLSPAGEKYWSIYVGSVVSTPAIGSDGTIYFGSGDRNVWAVTSSGITRWRYTTPDPLHSSPLVTETGVYIGDRNGTFYRFNHDGSVAWKFYTNGEIWGGSAMTRDGRIVFGSLDTHLYCVNSTTGGLIWSHSVGQEIVGTPLIQDVSIVYGTREDNDNYGQVVCLKMDGSVRWTYTVSASIESLPAEGPNGEVYVATVDGKIFAIQADGQLMWKYNTGGTGGVCKRFLTSESSTTSAGVQSAYSAESLAVATTGGDTDATDGSSVTLAASAPSTAPRYYANGAAPSATDGFYTGYRATFTIATGVLRAGQFAAIKKMTATYAPLIATHDSFTDSSGRNTAIVLQFTAQDRMVPGETVDVVLPGLYTAGTDDAKDVYPYAAGTAAGHVAFSGTSGTSQCPTTCTNTAIKLAAGGCGADDACLGSTITFDSGTGAGQTATIVDYDHSSLLATITYVSIVADASTTYTISPAVVPKFSATYTYDTTAMAATLTLTVPSADGTMDCATGCTHTKVKLATSAAGIIAATDNVLNGYYIQITGGTGKGQTTMCNTYRATNFECDVDHLSIIPDDTSTFRIGPRVEPGEATTLVIPAAEALTYPEYSGKASAAGTTATTQIKLATTASPIDDFYNGMTITFVRKDATALEQGQSFTGVTTAALSGCPATGGKTGQAAATGTNTEITLASDVGFATDDELIGFEIEFTGGTGSGQLATITDWDAGTQVATITNVAVAPDATTNYKITCGHRRINLANGDCGSDDNCNGLTISFTEGTGAGQAATIVDYDHTTQVATISYVAVIPDATTKYTIAAQSTQVSSDATTIEILATPADKNIFVDEYVKINAEVMKVTAIDEANKILTVERGQMNTARAVHDHADDVYVINFRSITDYDGATFEATFAPALPTGGDTEADDLYRITGVGPDFEIQAPLLGTDFAANPKDWAGKTLVPSTYSSKVGKVTLADEASTRADGDYVGATLAITDGPGKGLRGEITGYTKADGIALVQWTANDCGDATYCTPAGQEDAGTCKDTSDCGTSGVVRKASHYEIRAVGTVSSYTSSTRVLVLSSLPGSATFSIPNKASYCETFDDTDLMRACTAYTSGGTETPVRLEWSAGAWCAAGGGAGWGATSPCVSNGLIVTTSANKFVYGLGLDGIVKFKYMTGKRIKSAPTCVANADKTVTIYTGSNDHFVYKLTADAQKVLRGTSWYNQ